MPSYVMIWNANSLWVAASHKAMNREKYLIDNNNSCLFILLLFLNQLKLILT
jgi:hypothetical protein